MCALQGWGRIGTEGSAHTLNNNSVFSSLTPPSSVTNAAALNQAAAETPGLRSAVHIALRE